VSRPVRLAAAVGGAALAASAGFALNRVGPLASSDSAGTASSSSTGTRVVAEREPGPAPTASTPSPRRRLPEEYLPPPPLKEVGGAAPTKSAGRSDPPRDTPRVPAGTGGGSSTELAVIRLTNAERAKAGCTALRTDARLALAARRHSADMAAKGYFDHNSQDGTTPWTRMERAGYSSPGAENIAMGQRTAAEVMNSWMNSPGHRANILNCKLRAIGVGIARGGTGLYWTQDFGWS
jgi:uncharacterized protein YkwD